MRVLAPCCFALAASAAAAGSEGRGGGPPAAVGKEVGGTLPASGGDCTAAGCSAARRGSAGWTPQRMTMARPVTPPRPPPRRSTTRRDAAHHEQDCQPPQPVGDGSPQHCVGKLFITVGGKDAWCTAQFVADYSLALTAGHCCYTEGGFTDNWTLVLRHGTSSATVHDAAVVHVRDEWANQGDHARDFCFLVIPPTSPVTGRAQKPDCYLGLIFNYPSPPAATFASYGYPKQYGGEQAYVARGACEDPSPIPEASCRPQGAAGLMPMKCNAMHTGSSGGAWYNDSHVFSLNSFGFEEEDPNTMYGPYFGSDFLALCREAGGCATRDTAGHGSPHALSSAV